MASIPITQSYLPNGESWELTLNFTGSLPAAPAPTPSSPTPATPVPTTPTPEPVSPDSDDTPALASLTFREARLVARAGAKIRKMEWEDRWLHYDGLWHLTIVNPLTRSFIATRVLESSDIFPDWWRSTWTLA